jgi:hypothetical protein
MKNIDRVALAMSSNRCENYFSVLVKFTCGKRIYFGRKDGWKVRCLYVAASKTNKRLIDSVRKGLGVSSSSYVRELQISRELKQKEYQAEYQKTEKCKQRRKMKKLVKAKDVVSNVNNPARHKTEKLSPKVNGKPTTKKPAMPRKRKKSMPKLQRYASWQVSIARIQK